MIFKRDDDEADPIAATARATPSPRPRRRTRDQGGEMAENR